MQTHYFLLTIWKLIGGLYLGTRDQETQRHGAPTSQCVLWTKPHLNVTSEIKKGPGHGCTCTFGVPEPGLERTNLGTTWPPRQGPLGLGVVS